ncbi:predicted protein [Listeria monocytogenes FSL N3-165]|nr:predicted protein [Listeria monocytogenes FSL N3-165]
MMTSPKTIFLYSIICLPSIFGEVVTIMSYPSSFSFIIPLSTFSSQRISGYFVRFRAFSI